MIQIVVHLVMIHWVTQYQIYICFIWCTNATLIYIVDGINKLFTKQLVWNQFMLLMMMEDEVFVRFFFFFYVVILLFEVDLVLFSHGLNPPRLWWHYLIRCDGNYVYNNIVTFPWHWHCHVCCGVIEDVGCDLDHLTSYNCRILRLFIGNEKIVGSMFDIYGSHMKW